MANSSQAKKRARQNTIRRLHNSSLRSQIRTSRKKFQAALTAGDLELAKSSLSQCIAVLDKHAGSSIIHKNTVARYKARATSALKKLALEKPEEQKKKKAKK